MSLGKTWRTAALSLCVSALALLGIAQAAPAATISFDQPCYIQYEDEDFGVDGFTMNLSGSGFAPKNLVAIQLHAIGVNPIWEGTPYVHLADNNGNFSASWPYKIVETLGEDPVIEQHNLQASQLTGGPVLFETTVWMARYGLKVTDLKRKKEAFKFVFAGMAPEQTIYAHYVAGGKERFTHEMGVASAPCGGLETVGRLFPAKHSRFKKWKIQFDQAPKFSRKTQGGFEMKITTGKF